MKATTNANANANAKLIVFHPSIYKHGGATGGAAPSHHRLVLLAFLTLFSFTFLLTLIKHSPPPPPPITAAAAALSDPISAALLHYAATTNTSATATDRMTSGEITAIATALRHCSPHCNFLIFGLTHETLLWLALNHGSDGRTVFLDENEYLISKYEQNFTNFEGYDVQYTTKVSKSKELIRYARQHRKDECRPIQNLLFSDCKIAINDLPNHLYEINWDLILIDGPRGYSPATPGRAAAIFSAAVMGRSKKAAPPTHVFVHDFGREVERVFSEEFLCMENLVEERDSLAHFVIQSSTSTMAVGRFEFCTGEGNHRSKSSSSSISS